METPILPLPGASTPPDPHSVRVLLQRRALALHVQPIIDVAEGRVVGHEALVRTPADCAWRSPDSLFAAARREGCTMELEHACLRLALDRRTAAGLGQLFVNLSANALVHCTQRAGDLLRGASDDVELPLAGVVIELTEHERVHDLDSLQDALVRWRTAGAAVALDDFGDGRSSLRLWSELRPEYVKIDKYFIRQVQEVGDKLKTLRALQQLADTFGSRLIAEGVEEPDELMILRDLGIPLVQGYLLGRPAPQPSQTLPDAARAVLLSREIAVLPEERPVVNRGLTARALLVEAPALPAQATHEDAMRLFHRHPDLEAVALVDDGRPVGLFARRTLQELSLQRYFRDLYGRRPCAMHASPDPLCVDVHTPIEQLTQVLTSPDQRYLREGFVITAGGRYLGLGTGEQLVRRVTEARIEAARHANPLTFLPGNVPLTMHIERLLNHGESFIACYADLNHFKVFNDHYGYWRGDEMIRLQARCLSRACDPRRDFIGHVGGDDFVLLLQSLDWKPRLLGAVEQFNQLARSLYDDSARQAGGIMAEDRHGVVRFHGLTTLSVGVVQILPGHFRHAEQVASAAAAAKHLAKQNALGLYLTPDEVADRRPLSGDDSPSLFAVEGDRPELTRASPTTVGCGGSLQ